MDTSEEVLILGRHILHAYIEDMDIEPLIDHLAPDVVWLGAGREMNAVGRDIDRAGNAFLLEVARIAQINDLGAFMVNEIGSRSVIQFRKAAAIDIRSCKRHHADQNDDQKQDIVYQKLVHSRMFLFL